MQPNHFGDDKPNRLRDRIRWANVAWAACAATSIVLALALTQMTGRSSALPAQKPSGVAESRTIGPAKTAGVGHARTSPANPPSAVGTSTTTPQPDAPGDLKTGPVADAMGTSLAGDIGGQSKPQKVPKRPTADLAPLIPPPPVVLGPTPSQQREPGASTEFMPG